jgi:glycosyltransferase involved in cell wall biosynthesis
MIRVGLSERHGLASELISNPPDGIEYSFPYSRDPSILIRSPLKGFYSGYKDEDVDVLEAVLSPVKTQKPWIMTLPRYEQAISFSILNIPTPRQIRIDFIRNLISKNNFKTLLFRSKAGMSDFQTNFPKTYEAISNKVFVLHPAVTVPERQEKKENNGFFTFLFSGDFFRKGGANVVDTFISLRQRHKNIRLILCCAEEFDFVTTNKELKREYLEKISNTAGIENYGRVSRELFLTDIVKMTDVYIMPTYAETFGFAILEMMARGIPVISSNVFAIPEIIEPDKSGLLIDLSKYDTDRMFRGYRVNEIPSEFKKDVDDQLMFQMRRVVENRSVTETISQNALQKISADFCVQNRNARLIEIYKNAFN